MSLNAILTKLSETIIAVSTVPRFSGVQHKGFYFTIFRGCG